MYQLLLLLFISNMPQLPLYGAQSTYPDMRTITSVKDHFKPAIHSFSSWDHFICYVQSNSVSQSLAQTCKNLNAHYSYSFDEIKSFVQKRNYPEKLLVDYPQDNLTQENKQYLQAIEHIYYPTKNIDQKNPFDILITLNEWQSPSIQRHLWLNATAQTWIKTVNTFITNNDQENQLIKEHFITQAHIFDTVSERPYGLVTILTAQEQRKNFLENANRIKDSITSYIQEHETDIAALDKNSQDITNNSLHSIALEISRENQALQALYLFKEINRRKSFALFSLYQEQFYEFYYENVQAAEDWFFSKDERYHINSAASPNITWFPAKITINNLGFYFLKNIKNDFFTGRNNTTHHLFQLINSKVCTPIKFLKTMIDIAFANNNFPQHLENVIGLFYKEYTIDINFLCNYIIQKTQALNDPTQASVNTFLANLKMPNTTPPPQSFITRFLKRYPYAARIKNCFIIMFVTYILIQKINQHFLIS